LRTKKGFTQGKVISNINKDQQSLQRIESGKVSPSLYYLFQLAISLDVTITELMDFEVVEKKSKKIT
jgi:transcriptional regulator with XRE-family HTH domain